MSLIYRLTVFCLLFGQLAGQQVQSCEMKHSQAPDQNKPLDHHAAMGHGPIHEQQSLQSNAKQQPTMDCCEDCQCSLLLCQSNWLLTQQSTAFPAKGQDLHRFNHSSMLFSTIADALFRPPIS